MKRKKANRPPDDLLRWGPVEIARFGRTTYARNVMTPDEFQAHMAHLSKQVPAVAAEVDERITRIAEIVRATNPLELLLRAWWTFAIKHIGLNAESQLGSEHVLSMRMIDYIQSVIAAVAPDSSQSEPTEAITEELKKNVDELFQLVNGPYFAARTAERQLSDPDFDERHEELYSKAQMYWTTVRGDRYAVHLFEQLRDFLTPQDSILRETFGVSAEDIVKNVEKIEYSLTLGFQQIRDDKHAFETDLLQAMEEEVAHRADFPDDDAFGKWVLDQRGWQTRYADILDRLFQFGLFDLQKITTLPETFLRELAWQPGEDLTFFGPGELRGWPLRIWPVHLRPFLYVGGRYYCFDIFAVRDHIYRVISRAVFRVRPDLKQQWVDAQKEASEATAVALVSGMLGGVESYAPAYYQWPATKNRTKNWCECDGVVVAEVDEHLLVVEVKAGAFTYTAPANDFPAHIASAKALIDAPLDQGRRFVEYLRSADEVLIADADHHEVARLRRDRYKVITLCGVTLDPLTQLAAQAEHLKPLGIDVGAEPVWAVSLDDLRVLRDLLPNPLVFLHYLRQRRRAVTSSAIKIDDELDHLALYFAHNDYQLAAENIGGTQPPMWHAFKDPIDRYYQDLLTDPTSAVKPGQKIPPILQSILDVLAGQKKRGRFETAATLLDLDAKGRTQIAMMVESSLARQLATRRATPSSAYGASPVTIFCWQDGVLSRDAAYARDLTLGVAALAGEESRLLIELTFSTEASLHDVSFEWLRPDSVAAKDRQRIDALAHAIYERRAATQDKKIGRNDPCPCGSDKKYKKCHLGRM